MKQKESSPKNTGGCFYCKTYWVMEQGCFKKEKRRTEEEEKEKEIFTLPFLDSQFVDS